MNSEARQALRRLPHRWRLSPVWLVPLAAVLIGLWLVYRSIAALGPEIVLQLDTAEGLEAGKTAVKLNNVDIGVVRKVSLSDDYENVEVSIRMEPESAPLLVDDTRFWVVKPRVNRRGISGLETIITGAYIQMLPGSAQQSARRFTVLKQPPVQRSDVPGVSLVLTSRDDETLAVGDPVHYQGRGVGQVTAANFDLEDRATRYIIQVESPYDRLINSDTRFWLRSGVDLRLTSEGLDLELGSLQTLVSGGVTFGIGDQPDASPAADGDEFRLYPSQEAAEQSRFELRIEYLVLFEDSVRGLYAGAPVSVRGVRVGTVDKVPFMEPGLRPESLENPRIPVLVSFEPERLGGDWASRSREDWMARLARQFDRGLRARISPGNLLTGATYVELAWVGEPGPVAKVERAGYPVFPNHPGIALPGMYTRVAALLDKLNALPVEPVLGRLETTLDSADQMLKQTRDTVGDLDDLVAPDATNGLPAELRRTLKEIQGTVATYREGQPVHDTLLRALKRLNRILDELAPFVEEVRERPSTLIFGSEERPDPVPRADHP